MGLRLLRELSEIDTETEEPAEALALAPDLLVGQVVKADILSCNPQTPLREAAAAMREAGGSAMLVMESGSPVGIWTEFDALSVDFTDPTAFTVPIGSVMSRPVATLPYHTPLRSVAGRLRKRGLRHFLVLSEAGEPLGVLSQSDVVAHQGLEHFLHLRTVDSVVRRDVPRLPAASSLSEAVERMRREHSEALLVEYPDGDYGILTERDLVRWIAEVPSTAVVGELASRPLQAVDGATSLYRVRATLAERRIRHLGVVDGERLLGLVSLAEIMSGVEVVYVRELQKALRQRDKALFVSRRGLRLAERIIEHSLEGVMITDASQRIISVNPAFTRVTGYSEEEAVGNTPRLLRSGRHDRQFYAQLWERLSRDGHWQGEVWNRRKNGEVYPQLLSISGITDEYGQIGHYAATFIDITERKENEESIRQLAFHDPLTGLPNRRLLRDRVRMAIARAHRGGHKMALLFIDLDRFKQINDSLGHGAGDEVLERLAERLRESVREDDTVARMGGDEFVLVLSEVEDAAAARQAAVRVLELLRAPLVVAGRELVVTCSVGVSVYPEDGTTGQELLRRADSAMYKVKQSGRDGHADAEPESAEGDDPLALESALRQALRDGQLHLHYQPLIDAQGRLAGAEALLRWSHPEWGAVSPERFIPLAEDGGLILPIGDFVLREAICQFARWRKTGMALPGIAVNVSARQLRDPDFVDRVRAVLAEARVAPAQLTLELTETVLLDETAAHAVRGLKRLGVGLALDDFGTGYCALINLKRFPIDRLKIDRGFVADMLDDAQNDAIVAAVTSLARNLRLEVVAEGVENCWQLEALRKHGCDLFQGFLFAPALPPEQFEERFAESG